MENIELRPDSHGKVRDIYDCGDSLLMSKIDHWLGRVIPEVVRYFLKPFVLIVVMSVITLAVTGPIGGFITNGLAAGITWLQTNIPWGPR